MKSAKVKLMGPPEFFRTAHNKLHTVANFMDLHRRRRRVAAATGYGSRSLRLFYDSRFAGRGAGRYLKGVPRKANPGSRKGPPISVVTGGTGFLGSHLVDLLLERGHFVIAIDNFVTG